MVINLYTKQILIWKSLKFTQFSTKPFNWQNYILNDQTLDVNFQNSMPCLFCSACVETKIHLLAFRTTTVFPLSEIQIPSTKQTLTRIIPKDIHGCFVLFGTVALSLL